MLLLFYDDNAAAVERNTKFMCQCTVYGVSFVGLGELFSIFLFLDNYLLPYGEQATIEMDILLLPFLHILMGLVGYITL